MASLALVFLALLLPTISWLWDYIIVPHIWRPYIAAKRLREQGIRGPPYKFLKGCNEDVKKMKDAADDLVLDVHDHNYLPRESPLYTGLGQSLESASSTMSGPGRFFQANDDKTMVACAQNMVKELEDQASSNKNGETQVELDKQFQELTADIISHTAFGSSYKLGIEAFHAQKELQEIAVKSLLNVQIPGFSYLPTKGNWRKLTLEKKLRGTLMQIIQSRLSSKGSGYGSDLLGLMLEACIATDQGREQHQLSLSIDEIIHECKTFFFAGHETTSLLLTWTVFLLSVYPEWQARLRLEALRECGKENPNGDNLSKLKEARKLMSMVFLETLRLYGPALFLQRKPLTDITVGETKIPKDHAIIIPSAIMHRDKEIWGDDTDEFNPLRFQNGVTRAAKVPHALLAFSIGPRSCIGQNFAMLEAKSVMAMILKKFSFTLSPNYVHAPVDLLTLQPKFGLPVVLRLLDA
ncbi:hypothetical protein OsJ_11004 [Oryza sativa Japonica Group]|uniref:Cytochrome P450 n=1 Tax=Oryza sativa subsp. japonica TaxID=39947 RepID=B9F8M2_ORYSJ|nr:hypothetical protein OsJ_11004 [Oryza sativa Japonica Group]